MSYLNSPPHPYSLVTPPPCASCPEFPSLGWRRTTGIVIVLHELKPSESCATGVASACCSAWEERSEGHQWEGMSVKRAQDIPTHADPHVAQFVWKEH